MRKEEVEIYSDATNAAVIRHSVRKFPGLLVQGDTLYSMYQRAETVLNELNPETDIYFEMLDLKELLEGMVKHYSSVLQHHDHPLPFYTCED